MYEFVPRLQPPEGQGCEACLGFSKVSCQQTEAGFSCRGQQVFCFCPPLWSAAPPLHRLPLFPAQFPTTRLCHRLPACLVHACLRLENQPTESGLLSLVSLPPQASLSSWYSRSGCHHQKTSDKVPHCAREGLLGLPGPHMRCSLVMEVLLFKVSDIHSQPGSENILRKFQK